LSEWSRIRAAEAQPTLGDGPIETRETARCAIGEIIGVWYNQERWHSSPVQVEINCSGRADRAVHYAG
jgi:hypothetical protein